MSSLVYSSQNSFTSTSYGLNAQFIASTQTQVNSSLIGYVTIPGLSTVNYSVNQKVNNNWILLTPLTYSNGYYNLPETYQAQLNATVTKNVKLEAAKCPIGKW
jgi:hypothetical protein